PHPCRAQRRHARAGVRLAAGPHQGRPLPPGHLRRLLRPCAPRVNALSCRARPGATCGVRPSIHTESRDMATQTEKARRFRALHERPGAFIIPNPWDVGSARLLAALGFEALATTSAGF